LAERTRAGLPTLINIVDEAFMVIESYDVDHSPADV
jgi:hypothetical protein